MAWVRRGECNHCGSCCLDDDPSVRNLLFTDADRAGRTVEGRCPLVRMNSGRSSCVGHGAHPFYRSGCDTFPTRPEDIVSRPECSYTFEWV